MVRFWFLLLTAPALLQADERWLELKSGPFVVLTNAGDKAAREQMAQLLQFRNALGVTLGKPDLHSFWPIRVVVARKSQPAAALAGIPLGRDAYMMVSPESGALPPDRLRDLARLFLDQNTARLPAEIESGLVDLFSTLQVSGTHITLGAPVPAAGRTRAWARMHLLSVDPAYAGRMRVLINNLEQIPDLDVAYRNAFQKTSAQIEKQLDQYMAAGVYGVTNVSALALSPTRDLHPQAADPDTSRLALADLQLCAKAPAAAAAYNAIHGPEAAEGLGLLALQAGDKAEAARLFASAVASGTKSARVYFEAGLLETDVSKGRQAFGEAAKLNPLWPEPLYRQALLFQDLDQRSALLKKAAALDPRGVPYWQALAQSETDAARFVEAQKAWGGAERAAATPEERNRIRQVRLQLQADRASHEAEERRLRDEEAARDLQRVKDESMASIHEAESAANKKLNPNGTPAPKDLAWWSSPEAGSKVEGVLTRFDCLGRQARIVVQSAEGKTLHLMVRDQSQLTLAGGSEQTVACGPQKTQRKVLVLYNAKADKKLGTAGDAVSIEFR